MGLTVLRLRKIRGELPSVVDVISPGSGDEGTATLEIVHDMAPGAELAFDDSDGGVVGHVMAQNALVTAGADVIVEDIPFDREPVFQQGAVAQNGDAWAAEGISVHSSAGSIGTTHAARVPADPVASVDLAGFAGCGDDFFNANSNVVDIDPGPGTSFDVSLDGNAVFTLQWSEPGAIFPTAGAGGITDLDLYLMNSAGDTCLGRSNQGQGFGKGDTIAAISAAGRAGTTVKIVVVYFKKPGCSSHPDY